MDYNVKIVHTWSGRKALAPTEKWYHPVTRSEVTGAFIQTLPTRCVAR
jgi:hypothetical protein